MIEDGPEQTSDTGPRSRSKPSARSAPAILVVSGSPTGMGVHGTEAAARQTAPPSWSVAAISRWREAPRSVAISVLMPASDEALRLRLTIRRPPNWRSFQSARTESVRGPSNPTIITRPISSSSVRPDVVGEAARGEGVAVEAAEHPASTAAMSNRGTTRRTIIRLSRVLVPTRAQLGDDCVDGVDELLDVVLGHRRRKRTHPTRRHQHAVVHKPNEEISGSLLVRAGNASVVDHRPVREMQREHRASRIHLHRDVVGGEHLGEELGDALAFPIELLIDVGRELGHRREPGRHSKRVAVVRPTLRDVPVAP